MQLDLGELGFEEGGHLLVKRSLRQIPVGDEIEVIGQAPELDLHLRTWCRSEGHQFGWVRGESVGGHAVITRGGAETKRWADSERAGEANPADADAIVEHPPRRWGLAARGSQVEAGTPEFDFRFAEKLEVWADEAPRIYAQAAAAQWDPQTAIPWDGDFLLPDEIEDAVVQIMTYLIENEMAALIIPSHFIAQMHPHFREVMQVLAIQAADEARHIDIFTRRALLNRKRLGLSAVAGQVSLKTLIDEPNFAIASFLLSVLGEGSFLSLLWFINKYAPDPITEAVARLAAQDESRHVAFGLAHLRQHAKRDPGVRAQLAAAVRRRHDVLRHTAGLNAEVFDALLLLAAGSWNTDALRQGHQRVMDLIRDMDQGRKSRLLRLGFSEAEAAELSSLHTRNFM
jgi:hypothetical protein